MKWKVSIPEKRNIGIIFFILTTITTNVKAQIASRDSLATGYLVDAAEEYWPAHKSITTKQPFINRIKHLPISSGSGFVSYGVGLRESYENYQDYYWGLGPQDTNGYFLHRILGHADMYWNQHLRVFGEVESSFITGRNGGGRPVQDVDKLAVNQLFGEAHFAVRHQTQVRFRLGKQSLNYGEGTLLDVRDANVRRSFVGGKAIVTFRNTRIDAFLMRPISNREGFFDDQYDTSQLIAGGWMTQNYPHLLKKLDTYYLFISRNLTKFNQGVGTETRHTIGTAFHTSQGRWSGYTEANFQLGQFDDKAIVAWKGAQAVAYEIRELNLKPVISIQSAISSGDTNPTDNKLQTFNPIYPKSIYYGFIDNVGSANVFLIHPKAEFNFSPKLKIVSGYYKFWRQTLNDGIYAPSGAFLLPANNAGYLIGNMYDVLLNYYYSPFANVQVVVTYFDRGSYLLDNPALSDDIYYAGIKLFLRL
ncbi:MAG: alginate export family protein [Janthinobacterium lividum]